MTAKARASDFKIMQIGPSLWDHARLKRILGAIARKRILVIGDVGVDRYTIGKVERISPEAPVPIVLVEAETLKLGLAANVADNIVTLGAKPLLVGVIGRDRGASDFKGLLKRLKIPATHLVTDSDRRTVFKERIVSDRQQLLRVDYESLHPVGGKVERQVLETVARSMSQCDSVIFQDYAKGLFNERVAQAIFSIARDRSKPVAVDPNERTPLSFYRGASVLTPNTREAERLTGIMIRDEASLVQVGRKLLAETLAEHVVITRGKDGMAILSRMDPMLYLIPTYAREVYDVSGAGDTVISVLTLAMASGATIQEAAILGNLAAGVEVGKRGTATVSREEIRVAMEFFSALDDSSSVSDRATPRNRRD